MLDLLVAGQGKLGNDQMIEQIVGLVEEKAQALEVEAVACEIKALV
jgi:hypothetical protein